MTPDTPKPSGLDHARQLHAAGNLAQARQAIEALLKAEPNNVDALLLAAEIYRSENPQIALKVYTRAAQLAPQRPEAPAGLARLYYEQGNEPLCDKCLDAVIDLDAEYLRAQHYAGMAAAARAVLVQGAEPDKSVGFYDAIAAAYQRAIQRYPISPLISFNLGRILYVLGEPQLAYEAYKRSLELDMELTEAYAGMAEAAFALEQFEEAVGWCDMVQGRTWRVTGDRNDPNWVAARDKAGDLSAAFVYRIEAKAHLWMGNFEKMTQAIRLAAELEPWNAGDLYKDVLNEHVKLGRALLDNKQIADAIKVLEVGRDLATRMKYHRLYLWLAEAYLAQALAHLQAQDRRQAEEWLAEAKEIVKHPPVPIPDKARPDWDNLKSRLTLGDKPSPFGFLRHQAQ